jgi:DNA-binding transcriptional MerR regulator
MSELMTIQDFSKRTGISKSALRYYETKQLLKAERSAGGYRLYASDQVPLMKLISSLRAADVKIKDIQAYLQEQDENAKRRMLDQWKEELRNKLDTLHVSLRYLESYSSNEEVYLIERKDEAVIWFPAESEVGTFKSEFIKRGKMLKDLQLPVENCYFIYLSGEGTIKGRVGFGVGKNIPFVQLPEESVAEKLPSSMYIAIPHRKPYREIPDSYSKLLQYASEHHWLPAGPIVEWYRGNDFSTLDLLLPVTQFINKGDANHG